MRNSEPILWRISAAALPAHVSILHADKLAIALLSTLEAARTALENAPPSTSKRIKVSPPNQRARPSKAVGLFGHPGLAR